MRWMVLISTLFLSGCVVHYSGARNQGPPPLRATTMAQVNSMAGAQQPAAYKVGFMEGCDSGRLSAGDNSYLFKKDVERFNTDDVYQQGWSDGFNRCTSGEGSAPATNYSTNTYFGFGYYPYYYPGAFYSGWYYPGYYNYYPYYSSSYSIWLGTYGHDHHYPRHRYYASPWYGGHKHKGGGGKFYSRWNRHKDPGGFYGGKHRGGSGKGHKAWSGKGHKGSKGKSWSGKGGSGKGQGHKGEGHRGGGRAWRP